MIRYDWLGKWVQYSPKKIAVQEVESGRTLTYQELNTVANRFANLFTAEMGLKRGDRIAILAENSLEHFFLFFAAQKTGLILVPLNFRLASRELDFQLQDCQPSFLAVQESFKNRLWDCTYAKNIAHVWDMAQMGEYGYAYRNETTKFKESQDIQEDDPIFILYTSGTTGLPKGAMYTHKMLFWNSINTAMRLNITSDDRSVSCMPLFHTGGWNVIPTPFFHHGAYVSITRKFDPEMLLNLLETEKATMFVAVPTMLQMMATADSFSAVDLSTLRFFVVGGEPMPLELIHIWHQKGVPVRQGYGMTECGPSVTSLHQDDAVRKMGSIGKPNFYIEARIVDDYGNDVDVDEVGQLVLAGPSITPGYWKNETATQEALKDGWFQTGDLVRRDAEGYIYVVDRKKNMYISGGENVYPAEIEKFLLTHDAIADVAIIGVPDAKWGEVGRAYVVLNAGATLTEEDVIRYCQGNLAKYKIPKQVRFIDAIPLNDTGKINRNALRNLA
ncbi:MAG: o-succinylbenzoate--CoA ligase [Gemmatimonadetes bacterium]|nr:MAG: o-succinylbenzoate--CoA ligase [Gemmatimonadota bacterium]